jgi:hypothetical protein
MNLDYSGPPKDRSLPINKPRTPDERISAKVILRAIGRQAACLMFAPIGAGREAAADWALSTKTPSTKAGARWDYDFASYLNDSLTFAR